MRKMKMAAVVSAAALLTLGASFASMAATIKNGQWVQGEEGWQYVDKEGEYVEEAWCDSLGLDYWVDDEGYVVYDQFVEDGGHTYHVNDKGYKAIGEWVYTFLDEDADEESWFYFDAKGRRVENKKKDIAGPNGTYTYYFDEDGQMLTGWVEVVKDKDGNIVECKPATEETAPSAIVYCNENGELQKSTWLHKFPWTKDAEECYEGEDEVWYYAGSNGSLVKGKQSIKDADGNAHTYFFNADDYTMIDGWVVKTAIRDKDGKVVLKDGKAQYVYTAADAAFTAEHATEVYYATEEVGYAKKNGWREIENPAGDEFWFYFDKLGRAFLATDSDVQKNKYVADVDFVDGEYNEFDVTEDEKRVIANSKKIDGVEYFFNTNGEMIDGFVEIDGVRMYLKDGAKQTGKVTLTDNNENDYTFYFVEKGDKKYEAANGNYNGYCYKDGQLMTSEESGVYEKIDVTGVGSFIVDYRGKIQHKDGKEYEGVDTKYTFSDDAKNEAEDCISGVYTEAE